MHETPNAALAGVAREERVDGGGVRQVALDEVDLLGVVPGKAREQEADRRRQQKPARVVKAAEGERGGGSYAPELRAGNLLDALDRARLRVVAVVDDDGLVPAGQQELEHNVRA